MKIRQITETTAGATASGSVASVASPMGEVQSRMQKTPKSPKVTKPKKNTYKNQISEAKVTEEEISEQDLIVLPGMRRSKDTSFIPHEKDRRDHEVEMARSELAAAAKDAMRIHKILKSRSEDQGLMGWQQSYITLASDYLNSVADSLENQLATEMTGGVIAGGMSNFEENSVNEISDFKRKELEWELRNEPKNNYQVSIDGKGWKVFADKAHAEAVARKLRAKGKKATVHLTGASVSEEKEGLWANIHAKRERIKKGSGERMRKPGSKGAPTAQAFKQSQKTSKK